MQRLTDLIKASGANIALAPENGDVCIESITCDSRSIVGGSLFIALKGEKTDGLKYIKQAEEQGASAVLCSADDAPATTLPVLRAANPRKALAQLAAAFYGKQPAHVVAVTGTDGKTSTADFTRQFWHQLNQSSAALGTIGITLGSGELLQDASHTTPDPVQLHKLLAQLHEDGCTHLCMEASSHGLHQYRLDGVRLKAGAFTTLARDHMDYHKNEADYFAAKARLFAELLPQGATAVLNADDKYFSALQTLCKDRNIDIIDFGHKADKYKIENIRPHGAGQQVNCTLLGSNYELDIPLAGSFQVLNVFAAMGLVQAAGARLEDMLAVIPKLQGVPGRLEHITTLQNGAAVYIDYAHTPKALENILRCLRPHTQNNLHVVFGCGGDRDTGKRPEMGKAASELADHVTVTDDNPRSEDAQQIRTQIMAACPGAKETGNRKEAILAALKELGEGDVLVIAGKGHEKTQTIGDAVLPFHDGEVARAAAKELGLAND